QRRPIDKRLVLIAGAIPFVAWLLGRWRIGAIQERASPFAPARVVVVQADLPATDEISRKQVLDDHLADTRKAGPADLVVWGELVLGPQSEAAGFPAALHGRIGSTAVVGAALTHLAGDSVRVFNSAIALDPSGAVTGRYDKQHLFPFGEYVPFAEQ